MKENLELQVKEIKKECDELVNDAFTLIGVEEILNMDCEEFKLMQNMMSLIDKSYEFMISAARRSDEINEKLSLILERLETK